MLTDGRFNGSSGFPNWWISILFSFHLDFHSCAFFRCLCNFTLRHILVISFDSRWIVHTEDIFHFSKRVSYLLLHGCLLWLLVLAQLSLDVLHQRLPVTLSHLCDFKGKLEPDLLNFSFYFENDQPIQSLINSFPRCSPSCQELLRLNNDSQRLENILTLEVLWKDISAHTRILGNTRKCWIRQSYWHLLCFHKT